MGIFFEEDIREKTVMSVAEKMLVAARTAPKARGIDNLVISLADKDTIRKIAGKMKDLVQNDNAPEFFLRDANNILQADVLVIIGTKIKPLGLNYCGLCGMGNCNEKVNNADSPCAFNTGDLGIAIGAAVSVAADARVDNRVMFSVGIAVCSLGLLGEDVKIIYGIPLCSSSKNPFFDRK